MNRKPNCDIICDMKLYHGSKSGIIGAIAPISRHACDFGRGFYMGDFPQQPLTLICRSDAPKFYELEFDLSGLTVKNLDSNTLWALHVAYNRGYMYDFSGTPLETKMRSIRENSDVLFGRIVNDQVFFAAERFFDGTITMETLIKVLKALNHGNQYVAINDKSCAAVKIVGERTLSKTECENLRLKSDLQRKRAETLTKEIMDSMRHQDGIYFDEICKRIADGEELPCV